MAAPRTIPTSQIPDLITCAIFSGGEEIPKTIGVTNITIQKEVNKIPFAKIKISDGNPSDQDFEVSNTDYFIPGKEIEIQFGYRSDNVTIFKGIVVSHGTKISSRSSELTVECKDKAVKLTVGKRSKHYENVTNSDIAEEIIDRYGLDKDVEAISIQHKEVVQFNTTDWDFILSRMDVMGRVCLVDEGKITIKKPVLTAASVIDVLFGATILAYNAEIDSRTQFSEIKSKTWDYSSQAVAEDTGEEPTINEAGNLSPSDLAETIGLDSLLLVHAGKLTTEELKEWASARILKSKLARIKGKVKFQGFPGVKPGDIISLNGVGERFTGPVFVNAVIHTYAGGDWTTEVSFGLAQEWFAEIVNPHHLSAQLGLIPSVQGLQLGVVTDLEDPEGEHRVKVRLPIVSTEEEGVWMRIATLDAGSNRGTFFRPEIDDEVIVGFIFNDPSQAVILGMLHSSALAAPLTASNDNHEKGYVSREAIKMIFNDDEKSFKLETPGGKKFTINDNDGIVQLEDENGHKITFDSNGVTIESTKALKLKAATDITMEAVNIKVSPSSQFTVSAGGSTIKAGGGSVGLDSASVKINGSGMTEVKGGVVKIN